MIIVTSALLLLLLFALQLEHKLHGFLNVTILMCEVRPSFRVFFCLISRSAGAKRIAFDTQYFDINNPGSQIQLLHKIVGIR